MGTESVAVNMEYSPLNKFSSSGEEVEQFSLPATAPCKHPRPKRRRKRKEFDSLRTHTLNSLTAPHCCHVSTCLLVTVIIVLLVTSCTLAVMLFYMSNTVSDIEQRLSNLQIKQSTTSSSLLALQNKVNTADGELHMMQKTSENHTTDLTVLHNRLHSLETEISNMKSVSTSMQSSQDHLGEITTELAKLGSQVLALEGESANLKQRDLSLDSRLGELDSRVQSLSEQCIRSSIPTTPASVVSTESTRQPPTNRNEVRVVSFNALQQQLNETQHEQATILSTLKLLKQEISAQNESLESLVETNRSCCDALTYRVDQLETGLRETHEQLTSLLATSFEQQLINLTIFSGTEDIISRVINQKTSSLQSRVDEANGRAQALEIRMDELRRQLMLNDHSDGSITEDSVTPEVTTTHSTATTLSTVPSVSTSPVKHDLSGEDLKDLFGQPEHTSTSVSPLRDDGDSPLSTK